MKSIHSHDYLSSQPDFRPNVRALLGILAALAVTAFFCFCVAIALLPGLHPVPHTAQAATAYPCDKACACHRRQIAQVSHGHTKSEEAGLPR
jgi:hypothetical protein